jgi:dTDP-4-amino-4,6-dideoxygalactose transaminase
VHFAGYPAAVDRLDELCAERGIALIEDAAHGPGGTLHGRALGTWGLAGAYSLFSNKVLAVGEGGLVVTDDDQLARRVRSLRSHAMSSGTWERDGGHADSYEVTDVGYNYRIDEPRSALAHSRLEQLEGEIAARRRMTRAYRERLATHTGLIVPFTDDSVQDASCYVMPVFLREPARRDEIRRRLLERHGIQTSVHYPPVHRFAAYRLRCPDVSLPVTESAARAEITIPLFPHMSDVQLDRVVHALEVEIPSA